MTVIATLKGPYVDWAALSPLIALFGGAIVVLLAGLIGRRWARERLVPASALVALAAALGGTIWRWDDPASVVSGALRMDRLSGVLDVVLIAAGMATVLLAWRSREAVETARGSDAEDGGARAAGGSGTTVGSEEGWVGETYAMLLSTVGGMAVLVAAQNTVALFLGLELLSIPLYVLCASEVLREHSLESGLKYLIVGSVGSATLLYGIALLYGATGGTDFGAIAGAISAHGLTSNAMLLTGIALCVAGFAFKASVAPFHQWTPDVYEGAPTPITAFMAGATKVAALGALLRLLDVALIEADGSFGPALAALAAITIVVGNAGALGQSSLKRMLAYSSVAQAGYVLAGVAVSTGLGAQASVFYLAVYVAMSFAAFAVVVARERETDLGDGIQALSGLGRERAWLAWPMTISMLALAGIPATGGFIGKFYLIDASVAGGYTWLGVVIVVGSMISLGYYLPVVARMWMTGGGAEETTTKAAGGTTRGSGGTTKGAGGTTQGSGGVPAVAGGSPEMDDDRTPAARGVGASPVGGDASPPHGSPGDVDASRAHGSTGDAEASRAHGSGGQPEVVLVAVVGGAITIFFGVVPQPLFDLVHGVGSALGLL
jgi:NADH-quinone oxidoreductase subunit N